MILMNEIIAIKFWCISDTGNPYMQSRGNTTMTGLGGHPNHGFDDGMPGALPSSQLARNEPKQTSTSGPLYPPGTWHQYTTT